MDFLKEITNTFSKAKKNNFEKFISRRRPGDSRKDIKVFDLLYKYYNKSIKDIGDLKGHQNYHAVRKRISKELINFLSLETNQAEIQDGNREHMLIVAKYFIGFKKYEQAWEILKKEEKICDERNDFLLNLKIQRLMLSILPYYPLVNFEKIKEKILTLKVQQARVDEFQLYFIQIKNMFIEKIESGHFNVSSEIFKRAIDQYENIKDYINHPDFHLKIIEIIRAEYAVEKDYSSLSKIIIDYYNQIKIENYSKIYPETIANIEYIVAYTFLETRNFKLSRYHLSNLQKLMKIDEKIFYNYVGKSVAIESFIKIFENSISSCIKLIEDTLSKFGSKITIRENLNLALNLSGFYCVNQNFKKANQIIINFNQSDQFYIKNMGREWVLRKNMIKVIIMIELGHIDIADKLIKTIKTSNLDLMKMKQYMMVKPYIKAIEKFLESPHEVNINFLEKIEEVIKLNKHKTFQDPRLIIYYSWLKSKFTKSKIYDILIEEYNSLD